MDVREEIVRIITKDGATFLLGAPLPQPVDQEPEPVKVINIEILHAIDENGKPKDDTGDDVFRIISQADKGSHYEKEGLAIVTTVPYSEATRWDSVVNEQDILDVVNEARLNNDEDDEDDEDDDENENPNENKNSDKDKTNNPIVVPIGEIKK